MGFADGITKPHNYREPFALDEEAPSFDVHDEAFFHDEYGAKEGALIQELLMCLEWNEGDKDFNVYVLPILRKLRAACKERFESHA